MYGAEGAGPEYCRIACGRTWGAPACTDCPEPELLPGNEQHLARFLRLGTQWRVAVGMAGAVRTGLDYSAVQAALTMEGLEGTQRAEAFEMIQVAEQAALGAQQETQDDGDRDRRPPDQALH